MIIPSSLTEPQILSVGLEDPNRVWLIDGEVWREIVPDCPDQDGRWLHLHKFCKSSVFRELQDQGYLLAHAANQDSTWLKTKRIYPFTGFGTWTNLMLRDALLKACQMNLFLLEHPDNQGRFLATDAHVYNTTFLHSEPYFIDIGSFSDKHPNVDYRQRIAAKGYLDNPQVRRRLGLSQELQNPTLREVEAVLKSLEPLEESGDWDGYSPKSQTAVTPENIVPRSKEEDLLLEWRLRVLPRKITDVGANTGRLSRLFAKNGTEVVAIDGGSNPLNENYVAARRLKLPIYCVRLVLPHAPELTGDYWIRGRTWEGLRGDVCVASSVIHHLARQHVGWAKQAKLWDDFTNRHLWIEWIDPADEHVKQWGLPSWYNFQCWRDQLTKEGWILHDQAVGLETPHRTWYWFRKP